MACNRVMREAHEQEALFRWVSFAKSTLPEVVLLFHIPNGGSRNKIEAANLKRQGVRAGVPDLFLPVARGGFNGLFIEMKAGKNVPTDKQKEWINAVHRQGYAAEVCYGWEQAARILENYIKGGLKK